MQLLGAEVIAVRQGSQGLKEAVDEAIGYFVEHQKVFYISWFGCWPHTHIQQL
jgi:tryptophan synthase beta subunit